MITEISQRDVVFTPFMLRIRAVLDSGTLPEGRRFRAERSETCAIAVAVDEWVGLRAYAEHMVAEANAMLGPGVERIELRDEYGTGVLAFELGWAGRRYRLFVRQEDRHSGRLETGDDHNGVPQRPSGASGIDDLVIDLIAGPARAGGDSSRDTSSV
ncbi:hypothetical protein [Nocardia africana]|uniref:Uncharacterized protein n=1 Tax=Nocardia africana TaxID=134964 RepID=A0A378WU31_9NOCA|nr:hypothetical protein [Nocardia africana]MCC3313778.1 hypothetical protein [Nocardia africana]SUA44840.1 Uncharacterised protein [Nocardia africana]